MAAKKKQSARAKRATAKTPSRKPTSPPPLPIVGVGASAGGLEALEELFRAVPSNTGMAFVVVTHLHPGHASLLPDLLARSATIPVAETTDDLAVQPDRLYVATPGQSLTISNGVLRVVSESGRAPHLPIDSFFRSLAEDQGARAIGIVLSGTGTDGTLGLKAIKGESGMTMAQDPVSASYAGMPSSAIATGLVDYVLPPAEMPARLIDYVSGPFLSAIGPEGSKGPLGLSGERIIALLHSRTGHDFSEYKSSTIRRRVERRMNVHGISDPETYAHFLRENPQEVDLLFKELLITVTSFFRDAEAFEALATEAIPDLIAARPDNQPLRIWVPGCSTGEEAYSLAILLREETERQNRRIDVQIFATDLDSQSIETARAGVYPEGIAGDVLPERLARFFTRDDGTWQINKEIREMVIFAPQNVIKDPPFTKLDLLSCRNLLIYLDAELQRRLLPMFHYALRPDGILFLGPSETITGASELFETVDKKWKIFRRRETAAATHPVLDLSKRRFPGRFPQGEERAASAPPVHMNTMLEKLLLARFAPTSLVINESGDIIYIHGRTGEYLEPASGQARFNILEMAREGLQLELASALRRAMTDSGQAKRTDVRVKTNGDHIKVDLTVERILEPEPIRGLLLVTIEPATTPMPTPRSAFSEEDVDENRVAELERELLHTRESLQTTVEELETSNEELKSANEELQSMNEELQSTNEELETSKEEMQSLNEELTTVNAELQSKVDDLSQANDDMQNLLNSTEIATIFVDNNLAIKRYTEKAKGLVKLIPSDVGRPLADLATNLRYGTLVQDCREVLDTLVFKETEVTTFDSSHHLMRIMPYRTAENAIDGLVITFVDITRMKDVEIAGEKAIGFLRHVIDSLFEPIMVIDGAFHIVTCNQPYYETFQTSPRQVEQESLFELGNGQWDIPTLKERLEEVVEKHVEVENFRVTHRFPRIGARSFSLNLRRLETQSGADSMILVAMRDVTDHAET